jgi:LemA protein
MKKSYIIFAAIGGLILIVFLMYYNAYSGAVSKQENLDEKWNNVQSAYQRRADLIPNLVSIVGIAVKVETNFVFFVLYFFLIKLVSK